jgi:hypothetical protein
VPAAAARVSFALSTPKLHPPTLTARPPKPPRSPSVFLFLLSTGAGGVGLNLTAANRVVVFDPS